jgi:epidermal growth factor receptor kinase substrate 8
VTINHYKKKANAPRGASENGPVTSNMMAYNSPSNGGYSGDERGESPRSSDDHQLDSDLVDKHLLEHLATFTVNKESGILYPADGMRKLLQLEKTTGIWSQKMELCLDRQWVLIIDYETKVSLHWNVDEFA